VEYFKQQRISITSGYSETVSGGPGRDDITGGAGDDQIQGAGGSDLLTGGAGDDLLIGGAGRDFVVGGLGNDLYVVADDLPDVVADTGGFDTMRFEAFVDWAALRVVRIEDDILIYSESSGDLAYIHAYAQPAGRIEQFDFAGTLVDASVIDQMADGGAGGIDPIIVLPLCSALDTHAFG
jgi:Ca2+-binding RTX toxin-like protein